MPYQHALVDQNGTQYRCTDPANPTCQCGDRNTPRPQPGSVMTDQRTRDKYLLLSYEAIIARGIVRHYELGLIPLAHSIAIQRFENGELVTVSDGIPCKIHRTSESASDDPDRSRSIRRRELWLPYTPEIRDNDRAVLGDEDYRVIGAEHLSPISRLIVTTDRR